MPGLSGDILLPGCMCAQGAQQPQAPQVCLPSRCTTGVTGPPRPSLLGGSLAPPGWSLGPHKTGGFQQAETYSPTFCSPKPQISPALPEPGCGQGWAEGLGTPCFLPLPAPLSLWPLHSSLRVSVFKPFPDLRSPLCAEASSASSAQETGLHSGPGG